VQHATSEVEESPVLSDQTSRVKAPKVDLMKDMNTALKSHGLAITSDSLNPDAAIHPAFREDCPEKLFLEEFEFYNDSHGGDGEPSLLDQHALNRSNSVLIFPYQLTFAFFAMSLSQKTLQKS